MRYAWLIAGFTFAILQGCASSGGGQRMAPVVDISSRGKSTVESPATTAITPPSESASREAHSEPQTAPTQMAPRAAAPTTTHPAALALLNEAMRQEKSGELEIAAAKLERALKIEPRSALLWHQLAAIRLRQGQTQLAANLAQKSNSYTPQDSEIAALNQRIIAQAQEK